MAQRFYNTARWQNLRNSFIAQNPLCKHCLDEGVTKVATQVDHIKPISDGGHATAWDNLQSLCDTHHSQKTRRENTEEKSITTVLEFSDGPVVQESKPRKKNKKTDPDQTF